MKKKITLLSLAGLLLYVSLSSYSTGPGAVGFELTGATGTTGCGLPGCHATTATSAITVSVQLMSGSTPVTSYTPGGSYTIEITGTQTSGSLSLPNFGFQVSCVKTSTTTNAGTMTAPGACHSASAGGITVIEHSVPLSPASGSGGAGTTYFISIPWTAPVAGTGGVTIRTVLNAVNGDTFGTTADKWNSSTPLVISESTSTSTAAITGTMTVCIGSTTTLSDATSGGTWSSGSPGVATVSSSGVVTGVTAGLAVITYTAGPGPVTAVVTVNPTPAAITGTLNVCVGATTTLSDATVGGTWSSTTTSIATIATSGIASGVAAGTSVIKYTIAGSCFASATLTVNSTAVAAIAGASIVCRGHTTTLTDATPGGTWTSLHTGIATVGSTGIVTGVAGGVDTIRYTITGACGTGSAQHPITVNASPTCAAGVPFNNASKPEMSIYPNPTAGMFTISLSSDVDEQTHVVVTNLLGQKVKELTINTNTATDIRLNAPAGVYYITAQTATARYDKKVVLE